EYPRELVPPGQTPASYLRRLTYEGARWRWPGGVPPGERAAIEHELALIAELRYEPYFLTVQDIVAYARRQGILCQGRGSAANAPRVRDAGFDPSSPWLARLLPLASELVAFPGFPRHLSQHVGGFVISEGLLEELVPIENAAMPERTVVQWDKDDLNDLKLLKVDLLALGMLTALKRAFTLVNDYRGTRHALGQLPAEDPKVYDMISRADTIGVFQIESRAQMAMLPRLKPRCYDDLVIEVAIVRPGPIQGDMVHPYLRRRCGAEPVEYPSEEVREVLQRTLGVPIFQE